MSTESGETLPEKLSWLDSLIYFCMTNKLVVVMVVMGIIGWGVLVAPFDWKLGGLPQQLHHNRWRFKINGNRRRRPKINVGERIGHG